MNGLSANGGKTGAKVPGRDHGLMGAPIVETGRREITTAKEPFLGPTETSTLEHGGKASNMAAASSPGPAGKGSTATIRRAKNAATVLVSGPMDPSIAEGGRKISVTARAYKATMMGQ